MLDRSPSPWPPWAKGMLLAAANVLVIACAVTFELANKSWRFSEDYPPDTSEVPVLILLAGTIPALIVGGVLGRIAGATATRRPLWRLVLLVFPASGLVVALAAISHVCRADMMHFVPHACVPTFVAALILERTTRKHETMPTAAVRSG